VPNFVLEKKVFNSFLNGALSKFLSAAKNDAEKIRIIFYGNRDFLLEAGEGDSLISIKRGKSGKINLTKSKAIELNANEFVRIYSEAKFTSNGLAFILESHNKLTIVDDDNNDVHIECVPIMTSNMRTFLLGKKTGSGVVRSHNLLSALRSAKVSMAETTQTSDGAFFLLSAKTLDVFSTNLASAIHTEIPISMGSFEKKAVFLSKEEINVFIKFLSCSKEDSITLTTHDDGMLSMISNGIFVGKRIAPSDKKNLDPYVFLSRLKMLLPCNEPTFPVAGALLYETLHGMALEKDGFDPVIFKREGTKEIIEHSGSKLPFPLNSLGLFKKPFKDTVLNSHVIKSFASLMRKYMVYITLGGKDNVSKFQSGIVNLYASPINDDI